MPTKKKSACPHCHGEIETWANPLPTVDIIINMPREKGIILIHHRNEPRAWALPGGFVDNGETLEHAAEREAMEKTGLALTELQQFRAYSDPRRDTRAHTISMVFTATRDGLPAAADDADGIGIFNEDCLPADIAFDHRRILADYFATRRSTRSE